LSCSGSNERNSPKAEARERQVSGSERVKAKMNETSATARPTSCHTQALRRRMACSSRRPPSVLHLDALFELSTPCRAIALANADQPPTIDSQLLEQQRVPAYPSPCGRGIPSVGRANPLKNRNPLRHNTPETNSNQINHGGRRTIRKNKIM
jgi:hypothetical protein